MQKHRSSCSKDLILQNFKLPKFQPPSVLHWTKSKCKYNGSDRNYGRVRFYFPATLHCRLPEEEAEAPRCSPSLPCCFLWPILSLFWATLNMASKSPRKWGTVGGSTRQKLIHARGLWLRSRCFHPPRGTLERRRTRADLFRSRSASQA